MQGSMNNSATKEKISSWVASYSDDLCTWALYKTSNKEIAEDLVQETFLSALQVHAKFKGKSEAKT